MDLYYTPRSHFSRKVRLLLDAYGIEVTLRDVGNVANAVPDPYGPNPLMKVPTLIDGGREVFDSDHIAAYLTRKHDISDRFGVFTTDLDVLNARAVMNGIMAADVEILLARRSGIDTTGLARFDKVLASMRAGLGWLGERAALFPDAPTYAGFHLLAMWDHLAFFELVDLTYPRLADRVQHLSQLAYAARSAPR